jgi:nucleotide-binding universal stress UspA family protein
MAGRIVVGVDGSEAGREALRVAAEEARRRDAKLVVVHAWTFVPPAPIAEPGLIPIPAGDLAGELDVQRRAAEAVLEEALEQVDTQGVEVEPKLVEDSPGEALVQEAQGADLLVVGSHGHGAIAGALLGSVSRHVEKHAPGEVVIVRPPHDDSD